MKTHVGAKYVCLRGGIRKEKEKVGRLRYVVNVTHLGESTVVCG